MGDKEIKAIAKRAFPNYRGRKFRLDTTGKFYPHDLAWDGGSRNVYRSVNLATGEIRNMPAGACNPFRREYTVMMNATVPVPSGFAVVEHTVCCGKDCGMHVYTSAQPALDTAAPAIEHVA